MYFIIYLVFFFINFVGAFVVRGDDSVPIVIPNNHHDHSGKDSISTTMDTTASTKSVPISTSTDTMVNNDESNVSSSSISSSSSMSSSPLLTLSKSKSIPFVASFGTYPNPFDLSDTDRQSFHPVVKLPKNKRRYIVSDYHHHSHGFQVESESSMIDMSVTAINLATEEERKHVQSLGTFQRFVRHFRLGIAPLVLHTIETINVFHIMRKPASIMPMEMIHYLHRHQLRLKQNQTTAMLLSSPKKVVYYGVGRYDEDRAFMYRSQLFDDTNNDIDGYSGRRTIHVGIDINAPLGAPVYAFADGILHSAGYNPELGDYGYVVVVQHTIHVTNSNMDRKQPVTIYALYGHLDEATTAKYRKVFAKADIESTSPCNGYTKTSSAKEVPTNKHNLCRIRKGQLLGRLGDIHENGGWKMPHVHFQLSTTCPASHDMPGAVSYNDRSKALLEYPDPRYVLGELY